MASNRISAIRKQIAKLVAEEEKMRKAAIKSVVGQIKKLMDEHEISLTDLGGKRRGRPPKKASRKPGRKPGRKAARKPGRPRKTAAKAAAKPARKVKRAKPSPKYRSPENRKVTWSGRGRAPAWVKSWVSSGKKLDDLLIK